MSVCVCMCVWRMSDIWRQMTVRGCVLCSMSVRRPGKMYTQPTTIRQHHPSKLSMIHFSPTIQVFAHKSLAARQIQYRSSTAANIPLPATHTKQPVCVQGGASELRMRMVQTTTWQEVTWPWFIVTSVRALSQTGGRTSRATQASLACINSISERALIAYASHWGFRQKQQYVTKIAHDPVIPKTIGIVAVRNGGVIFETLERKM